jgi:hypothetical protein
VSIKIMTRVWEESKQGGSKLLLLLAIADNANDDGYCWPGQEYLAKKIRMSKKSIPRLVKELQNDGELFVNGRSGNGLSTEYVVLVGLGWASFAGVLQKYLHFDNDKILGIRDWFDITVLGLTLPQGGVDKLGGPQDGDGRVDIAMGTGVDIAMGTEPSLTVNEPSKGGKPQNVVTEEKTNQPVSEFESELDVWFQNGDPQGDTQDQTIREVESVWINKRLSHNAKLVIVAYILAMRNYWPDTAPPRDKTTQGKWAKGVRDHLDNYTVDTLEALYPLAVKHMKERGTDIYSPLSVTNALALVASHRERARQAERKQEDDPMYQAFAALEEETNNGRS